MKIATIAPLTYTPGKLEYFQFIRGGVGADYHQGPAFYQFADGRVRMTWGAYDFDECSPNVVALYSDSRDRGLTWSDPQVYMADYPAGPLGGPVLGLQGGREAIMVVTQFQHEIEVDEARRVATAHADYFKARSHVYIRRSVDGGRTFDHGAELPYQAFTDGKELPGGGFYGDAHSLLQLKSGRIIAAFCFLDPARSDFERQNQHYTVACLLSDDGGHTWRRSAEITVDTPRGVMEPQIVETAPDQLFCLFRTKGGYLYQTRSEDGGETWSASTPSPLPAPESMARMIKLQSGNLLVVWNNVSSTTQQPRHPLSAVLSKDGGRTWGAPKVIADETGGNQLSNHGLIQLDDGRILLGISHYRDVRPMTSDLDMAIFDEMWLQQEYPLPLVWRFRTDPANRGEDERWFGSEPGSEWCDIRTDTDWTSQGHNYHGTAWYSVEFECPEELVGKDVVLRFGAVDGICHIWLDGEQIGSKLQSPEVMWNRPFTVGVGRLMPGRKHRLVVRVTKENLGEGIWKPVGLLEQGCNARMKTPNDSRITIENFAIFLDLRSQGFGDVVGGRLFTEDDGDWSFHFSHSLISDYTEDDWVGTHAYVTRSSDGGATWSRPEMVMTPRVKDLKKESFFWRPMLRTRAGTVLYSGMHQVLDAAEGTSHRDVSMRDYMLLYARREKGQPVSAMRIIEWPPGTFMGEQFLEGGFQLPSGRLIFTMWGVAVRGENWRCGVLLSDDDGRTWRFRTVGYEPDLAIRDNPPGIGCPAGFNEQTLFLTRDGAIVSIIRGREKLGRGVPGGGTKDTWFFRSESRDEGETWSKPEPTNLPGTGATIGQGITLPDGSLLIGCRIPYSRTYYGLPEPELYGLNLARSFDNGRTWTSEQIIQRDPEGNPFNNHYCAMNGYFERVSDTHVDYVFGFFGHNYQPKLQRMLRLRLRIS